MEGGRYVWREQMIDDNGSFVYKLDGETGALDGNPAIQVNDVEGLMSVPLQRALEFALLRQPAQAEEVLRRALCEAPQNAAAHRLLAWCLAMQDRLPQAQQEAQEAIRLQPECDMAYHAFGWILLRQGHWPEAEKAIRQAIRLAPQDADHFFLLAHLFAQQGRWRESADAARQGRQIDPGHVSWGRYDRMLWIAG